MRLFPLAPALFASAAVCVNNGEKVVTGIQSINNYTLMLNGDVKRYTNVSTGIPYGLQVQEDSVNLHKEIIATLKVANSSDNFGQPSSNDIAVAVVGLLGNTRETLANVTSKAKAFDFLKPLVLASLYQLKLDTDQFGAVIKNHIDPALAGSAGNIISAFDDEFNKAIKAYGGTTS